MAASHTIVFSKFAARDLKRVDDETRRRIGQKLLYFLRQDDPLAYAKPLIDARIGSYRFRIGHYRVVFDMHGEQINVLRVVHRQSAYKK